MPKESPFSDTVGISPLIVLFKAMKYRKGLKSGLRLQYFFFSSGAFLLFQLLIFWNIHLLLCSVFFAVLLSLWG